ncbi:hypothetical protein CROQUDRAFT_716626 [Cronartium quercuum f. sp. fusiforme G11]|uniref:Uncharacterized protein n=1 Tax=Cronartium quercuum f. sp. fusiforme G11 TaxID=708437 RepID=A0A9P6NJ51_9BASI|nr:hypothetical protein CROQUDRAFT_716626 [Cronartium quercuum f. sp. fusiforme G11]
MSPDSLITILTTDAEPVLILCSGYIFAAFLQFIQQQKIQKSSTHIIAWSVFLLHMLQAICEVGAGWLTTTAAIENRVIFPRALALMISTAAVTTDTLVHIHFSSLIYFMINLPEKRRRWLILSTCLTITMFLIGLFFVVLLIITGAGSDNPGNPLQFVNHTIRRLSIFSIVAYFGHHVLYNGILCSTLTFKLVQSSRQNLGKRMKTIIQGLLVLTLRTFFITTLIILGLASSTLSSVLPTHPNAKLGKGIPFMSMLLRSLISRVYIVSFFSSFANESNHLASQQLSPQFLVPFNIHTSQFIEEAGTGTI